MRYRYISLDDSVSTCCIFVARVIADGKVTVPKRVRDVLRIEKGDYVRVTITEVIKKKQTQQKARAKRRK